MIYPLFRLGNLPLLLALLHGGSSFSQEPSYVKDEVTYAPEDQGTSIVSVRFKMSEIDALAAKEIND